MSVEPANPCPEILAAAAPGSPVSLAAPASSAGWRRFWGGVVAAGCASVLGVAVWLEPAAGGLGTHEQLRLPPCGWIAVMDLPCPTCGMTTAFTHAADGNLLRAIATQPFGGILALATAMALLLGGYTAATGSRVALALGRLWGPRTGWMLGGAVLIAWLYKIVMHRGLLG